MKDFNDKVVVITGAGSGMGREYATAFARRGAKVAICDLDDDGLQETVRRVKEAGGSDCFAEVFDISDRAAVFGFADRVKMELGDAHVVINNAGIEGRVVPAWALPIGDLERLMNINFYGVVHGCQAFLPQLATHSEAALVNVSSVFGIIGMPDHSDYCASKFAVRGYSESLMSELAGSGIQVLSVHPGGINTNIAKGTPAEETASEVLTTPPEDMVEKVIEAIEKKRSRISWGNKSWFFTIASRIAPLGRLTRLIGKQVQKDAHHQFYGDGEIAKSIDLHRQP